MKLTLNSLFRYFMTWLKVLVLFPVIVTVHLVRLVHGSYLLAAQALLGMRDEADTLLDELVSIDL